MPLLTSKETAHDRHAERDVLASDGQAEDRRVDGGTGEREKTQNQRDEASRPYCIDRCLCMGVHAVDHTREREGLVACEGEELTR